MLEEIRLPGGQEVEDVVLGNQVEGIARNDARPFPEIDQMGRGVESGAEADAGQGRGEKTRDGALAVRPGDMDAPEGPFGMAQGLAEALHPRQSRLVGRGKIRLLHRREPLEDLLEQRRVPRLRKLHKNALVFDFNTKILIFEDK